jgi:hypothetical protein
VHYNQVAICSLTNVIEEVSAVDVFNFVKQDLTAQHSYPRRIFLSHKTRMSDNGGEIYASGVSYVFEDFAHNVTGSNTVV